MKNKRLLKLFGAISLAAVIAIPFAAGCAAPAPAPAPAPVPAPEAITWKFQTFSSSGDRAFASMERIADNIAYMSDGRLTIEVYQSGAIAPATKELEGIHQAVIDGGMIANGYNNYMFPQASLFSAVSGGMTSIQQMLWYRSGGGQELISELYEGSLNVEVIGVAVLRAAEIWAHSTKPLDTLDDLVGLKFRTTAAIAEIVEVMGVTPVFLPGGEIYESTQRGVIDAFEYVEPSINWDMGFHEVAEYLYLSPSRVPGAVAHVVVNRDAWNELTPGLQGIVTAAVQAEPMLYYSEQIQLDSVAIQKYIDYGTKVRFLPKEIEDAFIIEAQKYYDKLAVADPFSARVVASMRAFTKIAEENSIS